MQQVIIIGSGFHKHVLGAGRSPLASWGCLLQRLCNDRKFAPESCLNCHPTLCWEEIVLRASSCEKLGAYEGEAQCRENVQTVLKEESEAMRTSRTHDELSRRLRDHLTAHPSHIVNLNFDDLAYVAFDKTKRIVSKSAKETFSKREGRLEDWANLQNRVALYSGEDLMGWGWHPHGSLKVRKGIRLGLRDYGAQISSFVSAFQSFKKWEKDTLKAKGKRIHELSDDQYHQLHDALVELDNEPKGKVAFPCYDTWLTRFMLLPVTIIGAGLSRDEIGLHWLLAQRARNLARVEKAMHPKVRMFGVGAQPSPFIDQWIPVCPECWVDAWEKVLS